MRKRNKLVSGVGINDVDDPIFNHDGTRSPFYEAWASMLKRCYSVKFKVRHPSYSECYCIEEWKYFSNFKSWMETQDWEGKQLDKDLLVPGNKMYSPETCVFVSKAVNIFMTENQSKNGEYPPGVHFRADNLKYRAYCSDGRGLKHLGQYDNPQDAYLAYRKYKEKLAMELAEEQTDSRIAKALIDRYKVGD